ncbi:non-ribosomal peptide synthetase [Pseudomonas asplenii]|uniref:non-ribosomal peptide synthetase n=1 Tax=Pseudomonas asplenii TaxID=53407 RepID=UPI0009BECDB6|nr:non-ribosomal peptide synthetase [Pseudomonas fuscovaginae]
MESFSSRMNPGTGKFVSSAEKFRVTHLQESIWLREQRAPGESAYNSPVVVRVKGWLRSDVLASALDKVLASNEALRACFIENSGQVWQYAATGRSVPFVVEDFSTSSRVDRWRRLYAAIKNEVDKPFDLQQGVLLRCAQFILSEDECVLVLVVHHIVSDGWSQGILLSELIQYYRQNALPTQAKVSFFEYAHARRLGLDSQPSFEASRDYWHQFIEQHQCAAIHCDHVRAMDQLSVGRKQFFSLDSASAMRLRALCASSGTSPFIVFLAVLGLLLEERNTSTGSWCIPVTVGYREDAQWFNVIGCFVDHVLVRPLADATLPFSAYLNRVYSAWQAAFEHRDYPFDRLRMEGFEKGLSLEPSTVFVYQNLTPFAGLDDIELIPLVLPEAPAKFDMTFMVAEQVDTFALSLEYDSTLYDEATIGELGERFIHLCERLLGASDEPVADILHADARLKLPSVAEGERCEWPVQSFAQIFDATARRQPEKAAIRSGSTVLSYGELKARVDALAAKLGSLEGQGARVGVHLDRSIELIVSVLAILSEGHCYVPLPPAYPDARLALQIADSDPVVILTDAQGLKRLSGVTPGRRAFDVNQVEVVEPRQASLCRRHGPDAPAYLIYTSGSTGQPKGAYGLADALLNRLHWQWSSAPYEPDDRVVLRSPPMFVDSFIEMLAPILGGACVVVASQESLSDPRQFWRLLATERITHLTIVPSYLQLLLDTSVSGAELALKRVHCSGEALLESTALAFRKVLPGVSLINLYGSTEVTADATWHVVDGGRLSIGKAISNTSLYIVDAHGRVVPRGTHGEIAVSGSAVGGGYHDAPALTADRFWPAPEGGRMFRSGDYGFMDETGACHYLGRLDMQIKVRGMRTSVLEIEVAMRTLPGLRDICVILDESDRGGLIAFYSADIELSKARLNEHARALLPAHAIPTLWLKVADIPRTDSGKAVRDVRALKALALPTGAYEDSADISLLERDVMHVWKDVLGAGMLSIDDHFDQVGGHSLLAIRLVDTLNLRFGCSMRLAEFFAAPTVRGMALYIAEHTGEQVAARAPLVVDPRSRYEPFPLLLMQQAYRIGHDVENHAQMSTICAFSMDYDCLSLPDFAEALNRCIRRHDMLRAVLVGEDAQRILSEVPIYQIETQDLSQLAEQDLAIKLDQCRDEFSCTRFEPGQWPSFRVAAAYLGGERYRLFFAFDMLFIDLFSARLLMRELEASYQRDLVQLPQIALSFRDYVIASQSSQQGATFERAKAYWLERMESLGKTPQLPMARRRPSDETPMRFNRRGMRLSGVQWRALQARAAQSGVSVTSVLLGAYASTIEAWCASEAFSLVLTLFDRQLLHCDIDKVVGDFTSSLVFSCESCANEVASQTFVRVQSQLREVLENRAFCGVQVQRELTRRNGGERIALPVVFTSALGLPEAMSEQTSRLSGRLVHSVTQTSNVWIDCQIEEAGGELVVNWDAVDEAFQAGVVEAMFAHYRCLLCALATQDDAWMTSLRTTRDADAWPSFDNRQVISSTLPEQVIKAAYLYSDHAAIIAADRTLSYAQLLDLAQRLRATLEAAGMRPGDRVGLLLEKGWEAVVAMLAINLGGCAYVPIDRAWPKARRDTVISAARLSLLITHPGSTEGLGGGYSVVVLDDAAFESAPSSCPVEAMPDGIAYIIFTSGTTGTPKGVVIEHGAVLNTIESVNQLFEVTEHDRVLCVSSLCFDLSVYDIWGPLFVGGACVMLTSEEGARPWRWPELISKHDVTVWNSVPALMELLIDNCKGRGDALASLRLAFLSGDWIALTLHARLSQIVPAMQLVSLGGATEASIWSIYFPIDAIDPQWVSIPYGRALPGQSMYVLDVLLQPCPVWVAGEIYIGGAGLARGYWESPQKTAAQFICHPVTGERLYRTGDIGCYMQDGNIRFMGRQDGQVKLNGLRIELGEVEGVLQAHPMVKSAVAILNHARQLNAYVVLTPDIGVTDEVRLRRSLFDHAQAHLPGYMVPAALQILTALPMGANGKVDRAMLQSEALPEHKLERERGSSDVIVEPVVAELWQVMLGVMHPQKQENFFSSGGDSLVATRFVAKLNSIFDLDLTARAIYDHPTLQAIAEHVERCRDMSGGAVAPLPMAIAAEAAEQFLPFPLTDIQRSYHVGRRDDMTLGAVAAHSYIEIDYRGLELARFEEALNRTVERHGMLRCVFKDGEQRILERVPRYCIAVDDVRAHSLQVQAQRLEANRRRQSLAAKDPAQWPLFSITATRHADDVVRLHISLDIIIADAWSTNLIARDLLAFYRENESTLPRLDFSFRDYVNYMASLRHSLHYVRMRDYWQERLDSLPPPPALPVRRVGDESAAARFTRYTQVIESQQWARLKMRSLECGATPSSMLLTVFGRVLRLACDNASFVINVTHFNRPPIHPDINDIVGDFASTFLLEYRCNDGEPLDASIGALCRQVLSDLDNSQYSGVQVLQDLSKRRGRVALAPVVFTSALVLPVNSGASLTLENVQGEVAYALTQTPQVWLDHQVYQEHGNLLLAWDVRDDVLDQPLVQALFNLYVAALERLSDNPMAWRASELEVPETLIAACHDHLARIRAEQDPLDAMVACLQAHPRVAEAWQQSPGQGLAPTVGVRLAPLALELWAKGALDMPTSPLSWVDRLEQKRQWMIGARSTEISCSLPERDDASRTQVLGRRSYRTFWGAALQDAQIMEWLESARASPVLALRSRRIESSDVLRWIGSLTAVESIALPLPKYPYPSAGSCYAVHAYLAVTDGYGLAAGWYALDPIARSLTRCVDPAMERGLPSEGVHLLLAADLERIASLYGEKSQAFAQFEAGAMLAVLEQAANRHGLRICEQMLDSTVAVSGLTSLATVTLLAGDAPGQGLMAMAEPVRTRIYRRDGAHLKIVGREGAELLSEQILSGPNPILDGLIGDASQCLLELYVEGNFIDEDAQRRARLAIGGYAQRLMMQSGHRNLGMCMLGFTPGGMVDPSGAGVRCAVLAGALDPRQQEIPQGDTKAEYELASTSLAMYASELLTHVPAAILIERGERPVITDEAHDYDMAASASEPEDLVDQAIRMIWCEVLRVPQVSLDSNFFRIGGTSIDALGILGRLHELYFIELRLHDVMAEPTVGAMIRLVRSDNRWVETIHEVHAMLNELNEDSGHLHAVIDIEAPAIRR